MALSLPRPLPPVVLTILLIGVTLAVTPAATAQDDAGSGGDAGDTFATATPVTPLGLYTGQLAGGSDRHDYYRFHVDIGEPINIEIRDALTGGSLLPGDYFERPSFRLLSPQGVVLDTPNTNPGDTRLMIAAAPVSGDYRFLVTEDAPMGLGGFTGSYTFCFLAPPGDPHPCPDIGMRAQQIIFGGSLPSAVSNVLLIPPTHGDLGNPLGPNGLDYLNAVLKGIRDWERILGEFATDHPEYDYLRQIRLDITLFDGTQVHDEYDLVIGFVETAGPQFRGVASSCANPPRCIALSLFSSSPRAGQALPDYPEINDLEAVTKHEVAHIWGLGHTLTWTAEHGPDLMNSPAPFVYGDGSPVGDGGERTGAKCISNLNLYGMAKIFQWLDGKSKVSGGWVTLPSGVDYTWYC
ncbi:MAG: hypothetical protein KY455_06025 [Euryarchaeota archaeon]|nr:hypothetical protein [Euryarchaeota archaeon]